MTQPYLWDQTNDSVKPIKAKLIQAAPKNKAQPKAKSKPIDLEVESELETVLLALDRLGWDKSACASALEDESLKKKKVTIEPTALSLSKVKTEVARIDKLIADQTIKYANLCKQVETSEEKLTELGVQALKARLLQEQLENSQLEEIKKAQGVRMIKTRDARDHIDIIQSSKSEIEAALTSGIPTDAATITNLLVNMRDTMSQLEAKTSLLIAESEKSESDAELPFEDEEFGAEQSEGDEDIFENIAEQNVDEAMPSTDVASSSAGPAISPEIRITSEMTDEQIRAQATQYWNGPSPLQSSSFREKKHHSIRGPRDPVRAWKRSGSGSRTPKRSCIGGDAADSH